MKGGIRDENPRGGALSQEVTKRSKLACCLLFILDKALQKRVTLLSKLVNPPAYCVLARMSSISIFPSLAPLIRTCNSGSLKIVNPKLRNNCNNKITVIHLTLVQFEWLIKHAWNKWSEGLFVIVEQTIRTGFINYFPKSASEGF